MKTGGLKNKLYVFFIFVGMGFLLRLGLQIIDSKANWTMGFRGGAQFNQADSIKKKERLPAAVNDKINVPVSGAHRVVSAESVFRAESVLGSETADRQKPVSAPGESQQLVMKICQDLEFHNKRNIQISQSQMAVLNATSDTFCSCVSGLFVKKGLVSFDSNQFFMQGYLSEQKNKDLSKLVSSSHYSQSEILKKQELAKTGYISFMTSDAGHSVAQSCHEVAKRNSQKRLEKLVMQISKNQNQSQNQNGELIAKKKMTNPTEN